MKEIIIYDNTNHEERYDEAKDFLFSTRAEDFDWQSIGDVPEKMIYDEMSFMKSLDFQYFQYKMSELMSKDICIIMGTCGRWNRQVSCGRFIESFDELMGFIDHLNYLTIKDRDGHLIINGAHYDGNDRYELKLLTAKGFSYADRNEFAHTKELHEKIMNTRAYSRLPKLASL